MGGDEVLHTVMEIRQNPYDDFEDAGNGGGDHTADMAISGFEDNLVEGNLFKKTPGPVIPRFGSKPKPLAVSSSTDKLSM